MPSDLELIKQLEEEIGFELKNEEFDLTVQQDGAYQTDSKECVIHLSVCGRKLKEFPQTIQKFHNLVYLVIQGNPLSKLPPEIKHLKNLTELYLGNNQLSALPSEIKHLTNLEVFGLYNNQLSTLPTEIDRLVNLEKFWLEGLCRAKTAPGSSKNGHWDYHSKTC